MESFIVYLNRSDKILPADYYWTLEPDEKATVSAKFKIYVPDQWAVYETYNGKLMILSPQNRCYEIEKILYHHEGNLYLKYMDWKKTNLLLKLRFEILV